jgi:hypothetical protein
VKWPSAWDLVEGWQFSSSLQGRLRAQVTVGTERVDLCCLHAVVYYYVVLSCEGATYKTEFGFIAPYTFTDFGLQVIQRYR